MKPNLKSWICIYLCETAWHDRKKFRPLCPDSHGQVEEHEGYEEHEGHHQSDLQPDLQQVKCQRKHPPASGAGCCIMPVQEGSEGPGKGDRVHQWNTAFGSARQTPEFAERKLQRHLCWKLASASSEIKCIGRSPWASQKNRNLNPCGRCWWQWPVQGQRLSCPAFPKKSFVSSDWVWTRHDCGALAKRFGCSEGSVANIIIIRLCQDQRKKKLPGKMDGEQQGQEVIQENTSQTSTALQKSAEWQTLFAFTCRRSLQDIEAKTCHEQGCGNHTCKESWHQGLSPNNWKNSLAGAALISKWVVLDELARNFHTPALDPRSWRQPFHQKPQCWNLSFTLLDHMQPVSNFFVGRSATSRQFMIDASCNWKFVCMEWQWTHYRVAGCSENVQMFLVHCEFNQCLARLDSENGTVSVHWCKPGHYV